MAHNLLDQLLPDPSESPPEGFNLKEFPHLDTEEAKLLSFIIRNNYVAHKTLLNSLADLLDPHHQTPTYLESLLQDLAQKQHITLVEIDGELWYRPQIQRRSGRGNTLGDIWSALESAESRARAHESGVNDEIRRTRSRLADSILPDMKKLDEKTSKPEASEESRDTARDLMADLFSAGRNSMARRKRSD